jgi:Trk K+ transport system NAD-binding subunit
MAANPRRHNVSWRWAAAAILFLLAWGGLASGVSLTERPGVSASDWPTKAYYSLGLFVVGGLDLGTPVGGPLSGRIALWIAYFGAPLLMASAVIDAVLRVVSPHRWQLRRLKNHIVVAGAGELTTSYLRVLRKQAPNVPVVVVAESIEPVRRQELEQEFGVITVMGDITHDFQLRQLQLHKAQRVVFFGENDFLAYETASKVLRIYPHLAHKLVLRCHNLRFMRSMQDTKVAQLCITFNVYHVAASSLVNNFLIGHFRHTPERDLVVIAGFGRFGQTILEELQDHARSEIETVALIDIDADRRVLVAEEQRKVQGSYDRLILQGDISHPEVWDQLQTSVDLALDEPTIILGTGRAEANLQTALWIKRQFPNAMVLVRTNDISELALEVGAEHDIHCFSIKQLIEDNLPNLWQI